MHLHDGISVPDIRYTSIWDILWGILLTFSSVLCELVTKLHICSYTRLVRSAQVNWWIDVSLGGTITRPANKRWYMPCRKASFSWRTEYKFYNQFNHWLFRSLYCYWTFNEINSWQNQRIICQCTFSMNENIPFLYKTNSCIVHVLAVAH